MSLLNIYYKISGILKKTDVIARQLETLAHQCGMATLGVQV